MDLAQANQPSRAPATGVIVLADGAAFFGRGAGAPGEALGELCFNTAMSGHQEIVSDPSYAEQIICFTAPHVGNVGANPDDGEASSPAAGQAARGAVMRARLTPASNWRAAEGFEAWLARRGVVAVTGVDTRAITRAIRTAGMPNAAIAHAPDGRFDLAALAARAAAWPGIEGAELARAVTTAEPFGADQTPWNWPEGPGRLATPRFGVVVLDFGVKRNILRRLAAIGAHVEVVPADTPAADVLARAPDGVVIANGPGDPAATAAYAGEHVRALAESGVPVLGICLGHQLLALAFGAQTVKMAHGHHGANHPVKDLATGQVEIVSMNHGFAVDGTRLPERLRATHVSLFDGSNCGVAVIDRPVFSVQHHPEASPGPHDAWGVFARFARAMEARATTSAV